jgi:hypothetical protein
MGGCPERAEVLLVMIISVRANPEEPLHDVSDDELEVCGEKSTMGGWKEGVVLELSLDPVEEGVDGIGRQEGDRLLSLVLLPGRGKCVRGRKVARGSPG